MAALEPDLEVLFSKVGNDAEKRTAFADFLRCWANFLELVNAGQPPQSFEIRSLERQIAEVIEIIEA